MYLRLKKLWRFAEKMESLWNKEIFIMNTNLSEQYKTRKGNDKVFFGNIDSKYEGIFDKYIDFITRVQLKDEKLWSLISSQFLGTPDDEDDGWRCEYWGKIMRGACLIYEYSKDESLYEILENTVADLIKTQDELGRISTYSIENEFCGWDMWGRKYVMLGMLHFYEICKNEELKKKIIKALTAHADYIVSKLGDGKIRVVDTSTMWGGVNSASILEPMVRFYNVTNEKKYLDFAKHIVDSGFSNLGNLVEIAFKDELLPCEYPVIKAYEVMSCFEGLLEYYRVTKEEKYKIAAENFVKRIMTSEISIIGCAGCRGEVFDNALKTQTKDYDIAVHMQETCVTVTWMKLCFQMYCLTGNVVYIEEIEKSTYNALYGSVNTELDIDFNGERFPFDSYSTLLYGTRGKGTGGLKNMKGKRYGCCAAIGAAGLGLVSKASVMESENGVVFNLYSTGEIKAKYGNNVILFTENTMYPVDGKIEIIVNPEKEETFEIKFRIPEFAENFKLFINNESIVANKGYITVNREWKKGDKVLIEFDIVGKVIKPFDEKNKYVAIRYGALILARDEEIAGDMVGKAIKQPQGESVKVEVIQNNIKKFNYRFKVSIDENTKLDMVDYASAGKGKNEYIPMEAWLPVEIA